MNLLRFLLIAIAVWLIIRMVRNYLARQQLKQPKPTPKVDNMVRCAYCGVHIPEKEALHQGDDYFCSREHRDAGSS